MLIAKIYSKLPTSFYQSRKTRKLARRSFMLLFVLSLQISLASAVRPFNFVTEKENNLPLIQQGKTTELIIASDADQGIKHAINNLSTDFERVTGHRATITETSNFAKLIGNSNNIQIIAGQADSELIKEIYSSCDTDLSKLCGKFEAYLITQATYNNKPIIVIAGSDKRGTIYGIYELSAQIGVSPWHYWADVPSRQHDNLYFISGAYTEGEPKVEYRGIFINDEAPAFSGWTHAVHGGFNSKLYEHVFELILRLKGNFLWPAMWGRSIYDDDPLSGPLANEMGIVIGSSHHEPMGRYHVEWSRYGEGEWNYQTNKNVLQQFWTEGMERMKDWETVVTLGMRGDGDEPMGKDRDIALLEQIIADQRALIKDITKKPLAETPQVWALYKEVQDYYDMGMRIPDDVTLLLCDDNWGNVRKLPLLGSELHPGGYGMYYHFDYVGGPRNYKWLNVTQNQRIWEQMNLAYRHGVKKLWVVNVGDIKPMEYPITFFLDMAWNPDRFDGTNLQAHTQQWCGEIFGKQYATQSARLLDTYTKYSARVTPELLNHKTYSLDNYNEFEKVTNEYNQLALDALRLYNLLEPKYRDAFDQLVLFPINGSANLYEMYYATAKNQQLAKENNPEANYWADKVVECFDRDSLLTIQYNTNIADGKWPHMMDQIRIGYTYWQQPKERAMPEVTRVTEPSQRDRIYIENDGYVSIEACNYSRKSNTSNNNWLVIENMGKTSSGVTTMPADKSPEKEKELFLEYDVKLQQSGDITLHVYLSPTLNYNANKGLRYAVSIDGGKETVVNFNQDLTNNSWGKWVSNSIIESTTKHKVKKEGAHTIRFRALDPGVVLQKLVIDTGGLKPSFLAPPESEFTH